MSHVTHLKMIFWWWSADSTVGSFAGCVTGTGFAGAAAWSVCPTPTSASTTDTVNGFDFLVSAAEDESSRTETTAKSAKAVRMHLDHILRREAIELKVIEKEGGIVEFLAAVAAIGVAAAGSLVADAGFLDWLSWQKLGEYGQASCAYEVSSLNTAYVKNFLFL